MLMPLLLTIYPAVQNLTASGVDGGKHNPI